MLIVTDLAALAAPHDWWVPAVAAPERDWRASPGCRRGARFLVDAATFAPARSGFPAFDTRADCLRWILEHRAECRLAMPGATVAAASLGQWLLGTDNCRPFA